MAANKAIDYQRLSEQLDAIVLRLQDDSTSIEESLKLYEEGTRIVQQLEAYLKTAENRWRKVVRPKAR